MFSLDDRSVPALVHLDVMLDHLEYRRLNFQLSVYFVIKLVISFREPFCEFFLTESMLNRDRLKAGKIFIALAFTLLAADDHFFHFRFFYDPALDCVLSFIETEVVDAQLITRRKALLG